MRENCVFKGHLGLGDNIIQQGIVNKFHKMFDNCYVLCKHHNKPSVEHMNSELPNVEVVSVGDDAEANNWVNTFDGEKILCGHTAKDWHLVLVGKRKFNQVFYDQVGLDASEQYNWQPKEATDPDVMKLIPGINERFIFVHEGGSSGKHLINKEKISSDLPIIKPSINAPTIFHYLPLIRKAKEVHCIDSSFALMIDQCEDIEDNLYWHRYARSTQCSPKLKEKWNVIN